MGPAKAASRAGGLHRQSITAMNEGRVMKFREKLRFLREREEMTQYTLADLLSRPGAKVWQNRMSTLENEPKTGIESKVEPSLLIAIAEFFNVPVHWLVDERLGIDDLQARPSEYDRLSEIDRQILVNARILGPALALSRLLGVAPTDLAKVGIDPGTGLPPGTTGHEPAPTLKKDQVARQEEPGKGKPHGPGKGGNGTSKGPGTKKPRRPKSRLKMAAGSHAGARLTRPKKKSPGSPK